MSTVVRADPNKIELGPLRVCPGDLLAWTDERMLMLTGRETYLLIALARQAGRILERRELAKLAWGRELHPGDRSVDVYVRRLRMKLREAAPAWRFIHTHTGRGWTKALLAFKIHFADRVPN